MLQQADCRQKAVGDGEAAGTAHNRWLAKRENSYMSADGICRGGIWVRVTIIAKSFHPGLQLLSSELKGQVSSAESPASGTTASPSISAKALQVDFPGSHLSSAISRVSLRMLLYLSVTQPPHL